MDYPTGAATGYYFIPATCHGLYYQPSAGTYTYYLLGQEGTGAYACYENQLSLVYLPTMYGSVQPHSRRRRGHGRENDGRRLDRRGRRGAESRLRSGQRQRGCAASSTSSARKSTR